MKQTNELYGVEPTHFKRLPYEKAIKEKVKLAKKQMKYYKKLADAQENKFGGNYEVLKVKYLASSRAKDFNEFLLSELNEIE